MGEGFCSFESSVFNIYCMSLTEANFSNIIVDIYVKKEKKSSCYKTELYAHCFLKTVGKVFFFS